MTEPSTTDTSTIGELRRLVWNSWGVAEQLSDTFWALRKEIVKDSLEQVQSSADPIESVSFDWSIHPSGLSWRVASRYEQPSTPLGAVSCSIAGDDAGLFAVVQADLPQALILGISLSDAKNFIWSRFRSNPNLFSNQDLIDDLGRNGLIRRIVRAPRADGEVPVQGFYDHVADAVSTYMGVFRWWAERVQQESASETALPDPEAE